MSCAASRGEYDAMRSSDLPSPVLREDLSEFTPQDAANAVANDIQRSGLPIVRIKILGEMEATNYLGDDCLPRGRRARAILGWLCVAGGDRVSRARIAAVLWDRVPEMQARASLRQAVRELVVSFGPLAEELVIVDRDAIRLNINLCWVDSLAVLKDGGAARSGLPKDLASYCEGEMLQGLDGIAVSFDQFLLAERSRYAEQLRSLFERQLRQVEGADKEAQDRISIARRLIEFDATHEGASRILMRALAEVGERTQAIREYKRCRKALNDTLNIEPSLETYAIYDAIRVASGEAANDDEAMPRPRKRMQKRSAMPVARNRRRVGVLPFRPVGQPRNDNLVASLSHEVSAALARFRWFDVIAPVAFTGHPAGLISQDMLRRSELDYVVDGELANDGSVIQISVRLLDLTQYAKPVWSQKFKIGADQPHRVDEVVTALVGSIDPVILFIEGQRKTPEDPTGLILQAIPMMYSMERARYEEAGHLISRALDEEPDNAMVLAWAAHWHVFYVGQGWTTDVQKAFSAAQKLVLKAIKIDPGNAEALGIYGHICAFLNKDFVNAQHFFDRALRLNPSLAHIWALSAPTYCYMGQPDVALQRLERYRELAPFDPYYNFFESIYPVAYFFDGDYKNCVVYGRRVIEANPEFSNGYKPLIAALGHLGEREEGWRLVKKLRAIEENFNVTEFGKTYPFFRDADRDRYLEGLRLAGVPEH